MKVGRWIVASLALLAMTGGSGIASAQAYQCRVPQTVSIPATVPDGPPRAALVTGYTLALNWSPEFCKAHEGNHRHALQCSGRNGRFGLVVHGLWPEGRGASPQWCGQEVRLEPAEARRNLCMIPSAGLMARQWAKHGSCMAQSPEAYFKATRILWHSLRIPDYDRLSRQHGLTAGDIRKAFVEANSGWREDGVGVFLNDRGWLEELRLCYSKRFRPSRCDRTRLGANDGVKAKIWRGL